MRGVGFGVVATGDYEIQARSIQIVVLPGRTGAAPPCADRLAAAILMKSTRENAVTTLATREETKIADFGRTADRMGIAECARLLSCIASEGRSIANAELLAV